MVHIPESAVLSQKVVAKTLSSWTDERLQRLFENRPDIYIEKFPNWATVAQRFASPHGVRRAIYRADHSVRAIVEVCRLPPAPPTISEIQYRVGDVDDGLLRDAIARMEELGLGLLVEDKLYAVEDLWNDLYPAGLGPPIAKLLDFRTSKELNGIISRLKSVGCAVNPGTKPAMISSIESCLSDRGPVIDIVEGGPGGTIELFERLLVSGTPSVRDFSRYFFDQGTSATRYLESYGIIGPNIQFSDLLVLPMEIGLAFRGGRPYLQGVVERPIVVCAPAESAKIDSLAASVAEKLISDVTMLLRAIEADRLEPLKSGGIRVKDLRRLAKLIGRTESDTSCLLGVAWYGGLVGRTADGNFFCLTTFYDSWENFSTSKRWAAIVGSWLDSGPGIGLVGMTNVAGKAIPPLFELDYNEILDFTFSACAQRLLEIGPHKVIDKDSMDSYLCWRIPLARRFDGEALYSPSAPFFNAAELLGVVVDGALSSFGHSALSQDMAQAIEQISNFLPKPTSSFLLGSDLTAVVDGNLAPDIHGFLEQITDLESTGAVSLYRFSEASIRRALDAGHNGEEISKFLETYGTKGLPQTLAYLIKDVSRRFGSIRVGAVGSYLNIADPALATEVLRNKKLARLRLRALGPNVIVSQFDLSVVMDELRYVGYFPVAESEDGKNIKESKAKLRTDQIPLRRIVTTPASQAESIREFISHLRFDDPTPFLSAVEEPSSARALSLRESRLYSIFDDDDEGDDDDEESIEELERLWKNLDGFEG